MARLLPVTLLYTHPSSYAHETGGHPENKGRIRAIEAALDQASLPGLEGVEPPRATNEQLARVHDPAHLASIEAFCADGGGMIDLDTVASEGSWEAALRAAGAACDAVDRLLAEDDRSAFCALRPPGITQRPTSRWASACQPVAIAAEHARTARRRPRPDL